MRVDSSSWLNLVERWFREITDKRIRRGTFHSVPELIDAIMAYIATHNENPKSFKWTAKAEDIIDKVRRARDVLGWEPAVPLSEGLARTVDYFRGLLNG